jgi:hypothetical protein
VDGDKHAPVEPRIADGKSSVAGFVIQLHWMSISQRAATTLAISGHHHPKFRRFRARLSDE